MYASACVLKSKMTCAEKLDYSEEKVRRFNLTLSIYVYSYIGKSVLNDYLGSSTYLCYIQNHVKMNCVIKRLRCTYLQVYQHRYLGILEALQKTSYLNDT